MENKEEIIEEINEVEDVAVKNNVKTSKENVENGILDGIDVNAALNNINVNDDNISPSKSKTLLIVLLSSLLAIDVVALIIYIIGIDKVLAFIK